MACVRACVRGRSLTIGSGTDLNSPSILTNRSPLASPRARHSSTASTTINVAWRRFAITLPRRHWNNCPIRPETFAELPRTRRIWRSRAVSAAKHDSRWLMAASSEGPNARCFSASAVVAAAPPVLPTVAAEAVGAHTAAAAPPPPPVAAAPLLQVGASLQEALAAFVNACGEEVAAAALCGRRFGALAVGARRE